MKSYPNIGERRRSKPQGLCKICEGNKSDARVDVQVSNFRGEDEVYKVHWKCIKKLNDADLLMELWK